MNSKVYTAKLQQSMSEIQSEVGKIMKEKKSTKYEKGNKSH